MRKIKIMLDKITKISTARKTNKAFTLAEVLITLGIIGIVAAMTIPTLMNNANDKKTVTALKKAYSALSQAYLMAVEENGPPDSWGMTDGNEPSREILGNNLLKYMNTTEKCIGTTGCLYNGPIKYLSGTSWENYYAQAFPKARLADGTNFMIGGINSPTCTASYGTTQQLQSVCGFIFIDTDGDKGRNTLGIDIFRFHVTNSGIVPVGTAAETTLKFTTNCQIGSAESTGCAGWVIFNGNLDYQKCTDLDWNVKTKCN